MTAFASESTIILSLVRRGKTLSLDSTLYHKDETTPVKKMIPQLLSPLSDFADLIMTYFREIWSFLLYIGLSSAVIVVLVGAILEFTKAGLVRGRNLVMSGILLAIICEYFILFPPF